MRTSTATRNGAARAVTQLWSVLSTLVPLLSGALAQSCGSQKTALSWYPRANHASGTLAGAYDDDCSDMEHIFPTDVSSRSRGVLSMPELTIVSDRWCVSYCTYKVAHNDAHGRIACSRHILSDRWCVSYCTYKVAHNDAHGRIACSRHNCISAHDHAHPPINRLVAPIATGCASIAPTALAIVRRLAVIMARTARCGSILNAVDVGLGMQHPTTILRPCPAAGTAAPVGLAGRAPSGPALLGYALGMRAANTRTTQTVCKTNNAHHRHHHRHHRHLPHLHRHHHNPPRPHLHRHRLVQHLPPQHHRTCQAQPQAWMPEESSWS